ncbi:MAG: hypothetical protein J7452_02140 [Thermoflexus sp.]|jgi:hypothetical protein|nr:hypothetical protein [Thermoflexus sp.]
MRAVLWTADLLGSIPTAYRVARKVDRLDIRYALYPVFPLPTVDIKKGLDTLRRSGDIRRVLHPHR